MGFVKSPWHTVRRVSGRQTQTENELEMALSHVLYELFEVAAMAAGRRTAHGARDQVAFLEGTLLHARNAIEFLFGRWNKQKGARTWKPSDIQPEDFGPGWVPPAGDEANRLIDALPIIDQQLSHLSWRRVRNAKEEWAYPNIAHDVVVSFRAFEAHLRSAGRTTMADRVHTQLTLAEKELGPTPTTPVVATTSDSFLATGPSVVLPSQQA